MTTTGSVVDKDLLTRMVTASAAGRRPLIRALFPDGDYLEHGLRFDSDKGWFFDPQDSGGRRWAQAELGRCADGSGYRYRVVYAPAEEPPFIDFDINWSGDVEVHGHNLPAMPDDPEVQARIALSALALTKGDSVFWFARELSQGPRRWLGGPNRIARRINDAIEEARILYSGKRMGPHLNVEQPPTWYLSQLQGLPHRKTRKVNIYAGPTGVRVACSAGDDFGFVILITWAGDMMVEGVNPNHVDGTRVYPTVTAGLLLSYLTGAEPDILERILAKADN